MDLSKIEQSTLDMRTGIERIADERIRQVTKGYNAEHDIEHSDQSIAWAAAYYAAPRGIFKKGLFRLPDGNYTHKLAWPWKEDPQKSQWI